MTTMTDQNTPNNHRSASQLFTIIIGDSPTTVITDLHEVATILEVESKSTAHKGLIDTQFKTNIENNIKQSYINQLKLYGLILDRKYNNQTQKAYILQTHSFNEVGNYEQRGLIKLDTQYLYICIDDQRYVISTVNNTVVTQPESDVNMITLSKFYTSIRNKLDLRRYPKTKVKSTGLHLLSNNLTEYGNYRKWYYGVSHDSKGEAKVTLIPYLSGGEVSLGESTTIEINEQSYNDRQKRTLSTIGQQWNINEFEHAREPIPIHKVEDRFAFKNPMPNVVNMPIKMAGDCKVYLPSEYEGMVETLSKINAYEKANNPNYNDYYAYLTIDKTYVKEGSSQSRFVYYVDGYQSTEQTDMSVQRNYNVTDVVPNSYVISKNADNYINQTQHDEVMEAIPFQIYHYDAYQVHSPTRSMATTDKTTLSVSFTPRKLTQLGNGINPLIEYEWTYTPLEAEVTE